MIKVKRKRRRFLIDISCNMVFLGRPFTGDNIKSIENILKENNTNMVDFLINALDSLVLPWEIVGNNQMHEERKQKAFEYLMEAIEFNYMVCNETNHLKGIDRLISFRENADSRIQGMLEDLARNMVFYINSYPFDCRSKKDIKAKKTSGSILYVKPHVNNLLQKGQNTIYAYLNEYVMEFELEDHAIIEARRVTGAPPILSKL